MNRLPPHFLPHQVRVAAFKIGGGLGGGHAPARDVDAFVVDETQAIVGIDGKDTVSSANVSTQFDELAPLGSRVTLWPGTGIERTSTIVKITRFQHPTLPWHQVLWLK